MSVLKMGNYYKYVGWKDNSKKTLLTAFPFHALQLSVRFRFSRKSPQVRFSRAALQTINCLYSNEYYIMLVNFYTKTKEKYTVGIIRRKS